MEELFRKMGPVYPVLEEEEPPEEPPEEKGGQEEEKEDEEHEEWKPWQESWKCWREEREQQQEEEKYLEEACQEVQKDTKAAKTRDFMEASEECEKEIQAAKDKFKTRMAGKPGMILLPTSPQHSNHDATFNMEKQENIIAADEFITDDESDNDHGQTKKKEFLQFLHCKEKLQVLDCKEKEQIYQEKDKLLYKYTSIPDKAHKCVTKVAEGVKDLQDQNQKQRRKAIIGQQRRKARAAYYQAYHKAYYPELTKNNCYPELELPDALTRDGNQTHSVPRAGKKPKDPPECRLASHLPGLFRHDCVKEKQMTEKYHRSFRHDCVKDTENTSGNTSEEEPDGPTRWVQGAKDLGVNTTKYCDECGDYNTRIEFSPVNENLREFLYLIRHAEVLVDLERMTRERDEATSKRQQKKLNKQIKRKRAKYSATHILNQILKEEKARTEKERIRQEGKVKRQTRKMPELITKSKSCPDREEQLDWADAYTKYAEEGEEPESQDRDRQEDRYLKEASGKLVETFVKWRLSEIAEIRSAEDIVTISSDSEFSEDSDCDWEAYKMMTESNQGYKCKCRKGHETKKDTIECIAKEDYEAETAIWAEAVNELGIALKREEVSTKTLANDIRVEALVMGIRRDSPPEPKFTGGALRPKSQECHQGDLYQEAKRQARQEGPPKHTYVYNGPTDSWLKYFANPNDVLTYILGKISQTAERKAIRSKIKSMVALSKCFQEITHREENARKGYAVGQNLRQYDGGRRIEKKAKKIIIQWEKERTRYAQVQRNIINMAQEPPRKPGPTTKCDGCQKVPDSPDSRLRQCGRCNRALYCTRECQRRQWPHHRENCEYWVMLRQARRDAK